MAECGIVIGASRGIGKELTKRLAAQYPNLSIIAVSSSITSTPTAAEFSQSYSNISCFDADMSTTIGIASLIGYIQGKIRFLVYVSGIPGPMWPENITPDDFDSVMNINTRAIFFLARGLTDKFAQDSKLLIVTAAVAHGYLIPFPLYAISKAALYMTYQVLKQEIKTTAVGAVNPGVVRSHISDTVGRKMQIDLNIRRIEPELSAKFLAYLISDRVSNERFSQAEWNIYTADYQSEWLEEGDERPVPPFKH